MKSKTTTPPSHRKVKRVRRLSSKKKIEGYRLMDMTVFNDFINSLACPECFECHLFIEKVYEMKKDLALLICVDCNNCGYSKTSYTSQTINNDKVKGMKPFDINYRAVYAARTTSQSYAGLEKLCGMLNLPKPMTHKNNDAVSSVLCQSAKQTAESSMIEAANELRPNDNVADIGISVDGTWQKRGFLSLNGTVAIISMDNGKIIDVETMQRFCKPCQQHNKVLSADDFTIWYEKHKDDCAANYDGSAPMMEVEGTKRMFERSITNRNVRYIKYYGDGDSKAYREVKDVYKLDMVDK